MFRFVLLAFVVTLCACFDGLSSSESGSAFYDLVGMESIRSSGAVVTLGTNDSNANVNERPQMRVSITYDFMIGKAEVQCGEFNALMESATGLSLECVSKDLPATNLTYYDAVLFANERSKAEGFDTAYTYVSAQFDNANHCISLEGFAFHPEVIAYRLPTEAEWMLVAKAYGNLERSWTADNSNYELHTPCSISLFRVCDLYGNAMEWVNDWLGDFNDTTVTNYVGAPDGGSLGLRIVKGGSFRNLASTIKPYSRGDVYTVTSSTLSYYVGFRLAFGKIPDATWMRSDGNVVGSRVLSLASSSRMRSMTGTYKVKLAFRNDVTKNLDFIDYSNRSPVVSEIVDTLDVYHPDISPDGSKVAFCTGLEGVSGKSELYVRDLNESGSNLVRLDVKSAAIPRWRVLENGDTVIVYVTDAGNNKNEATFKSSSTWMVKFSNGKFGKPEKLFDGAYHGGISEDNTLAVSGARLLRARMAKSGSTVLEKAVDTVWYDGNQACNASLAKDSSKRTLFLDFGGSGYGTHERLLVMDKKGKLIQSVSSPEGYSFDHSEWALGGANMAVATLANANGAHQRIVLVQLTDSSIVDLVEGDELWHPCLWVKDKVTSLDNSLLNLDSVGVYYIEGQDWMYESLGFKITQMWKHMDEIEILGVGSSRVECSIIPLEMKTGYTMNLGHMGNDLNASLFVAQNYGVRHLKKLKYIVVAIDIDLWISSTDFSDIIFPLLPGYVYDTKHLFWKDGLPNGFLYAVENATNYSEYAREAYEESRGHLGNPTVEWGTPIIEKDSLWPEDRLENLSWNLNILENFLNEMESSDIKIIGVVFPQNPRYRETGTWGRYGPRRSVAAEVLDSVVELQKRYDNFILMDENRNGNHDYTDDEARNSDHLSIKGAKKLTHRLDSLLSTLEE